MACKIVKADNSQTVCFDAGRLLCRSGENAPTARPLHASELKEDEAVDMM